MATEAIHAFQARGIHPFAACIIQRIPISLSTRRSQRWVAEGCRGVGRLQRERRAIFLLPAQVDIEPPTPISTAPIALLVFASLSHCRCLVILQGRFPSSGELVGKSNSHKRLQGLWNSNIYSTTVRSMGPLWIWNSFHLSQRAKLNENVCLSVIRVTWVILYQMYLRVTGVSSFKSYLNMISAY